MAPAMMTPIAVSGVEIYPPQVIIDVGASLTPRITVAPSNASNQKVTFASDDAQVVTVDENGFVKGVGQGEAEITVTTDDQGETATMNVKVVDPSLIGRAFRKQSLSSVDVLPEPAL